MSNSRVRNTTRNMISGVAMQIVSVLLTFLCRTAFVKLLPTEYLGLSGTFSNIISLFSLSELGIGSAIIVNLYKPIAEGDEQRIRKLMTFYASAYRMIGIFVITAGLILCPFIPYLCKTDVEIAGLRYYFLVFVLQSASSYFFAYRRSLITACQREYIATISSQLSTVLMNIMQIIVLLLTGNYLLYLFVSIFCNYANNGFIYWYVGREYAFIREHKQDRLDKREIRELFKDVASTMVLKLGNVVVNSTDSLLISSYLGLYWNGLYSNYLLIINSVNQFALIIFNAASASIGDFNASQSSDETYFLFKAFRFTGSWLYGFCAVCFTVLFTPFITLWIGEGYLLDMTTVVILALNFYFTGLMRIFEMFSIPAKLFHKTRIKAVSMAGVNLTASIILMRIFGLKGVFMGTLIGYLTSGAWIDVYYLYKKVFLKGIFEHFTFTCFHVLVTVGCGIFTYVICTCIPFFVLKMGVCAVVPNLIYLAVFGRKKEFAFLVGKVSFLINKRV